MTDIPQSDDNLQTTALTAECTTPIVLLEAEIEDDNHDHNYIYNDFGGQRCKDYLINNDTGDIGCQNTDFDCLDLATQNHLIVEMLLEVQAQWEPKQRLQWEKMLAELERRAAKRDQWAANRAEWTKQSTVEPRQTIDRMLDPITF